MFLQITCCILHILKTLGDFTNFLKSGGQIYVVLLFGASKKVLEIWDTDPSISIIWIWRLCIDFPKENKCIAGLLSHRWIVKINIVKVWILLWLDKLVKLEWGGEDQQLDCSRRDCALSKENWPLLFDIWIFVEEWITLFLYVCFHIHFSSTMFCTIWGAAVA